MANWATISQQLANKIWREVSVDVNLRSPGRVVPPLAARALPNR